LPPDDTGLMTTPLQPMAIFGAWLVPATVYSVPKKKMSNLTTNGGKESDATRTHQ